MVHAFSEYTLSNVQNRMGELFELAVVHEDIPIDEFTDIFVSSKICHSFEIGDPVFVLGKSSSELLGLILNKDPVEYETHEYATPEYWVGWVLSFTQWYLNKPYKTLTEAYPCSKLLLDYFPYHEMDEMHVVDLFRSKMQFESALKNRRRQKGFSQKDLSLLSDVPLRTIKSYEQGSVDLSNAQVGTLYRLAKTLGCSIEELIT